MTDIDRDVAERTTRLEQETKELLKLWEQYRGNIHRLMLRIALQQRTNARRN